MMIAGQPGADGPVRTFAQVSHARLDRPVEPVRMLGPHSGRHLRPGAVTDVRRGQRLQRFLPAGKGVPQPDPAAVNKRDGTDQTWRRGRQFDHDVAAPGLPGDNRSVQIQRRNDRRHVGGCGRRVVPGCGYG